MGFTEPTPIQKQAIPAGLTGRDIMASAMTGSGKTAAFLLPIMHRLLDQPRGKTRALIVTPTRELAAQIHEHFEALAGHTGLSAAAVFGGVGMRPQEQAFRRGVDLIAATPGRLLDHLQYPYADLGSVEMLVLDEADRMLDMGFLPDVRRILKEVPKDRQTLFFSATMPQPIVKLAGEMLRDPVSITLARKSAPATGIEQAFYPVPDELKPQLFVELIRRGDVGNAIAFCRTKHRANRLFEVLEKNDIPAARIHGNRSQAARTQALEGFKTGKYRVLVATDIVARGIDVEALEHVVNFDVPAAAEDYIHRVGRTARAEATGDAYTLVSPQEEKEVRAITKAVGKEIPRVTLPDFDYKAKPEERFEVPIGERIAEIRARKAEDRKRAQAKKERKERNLAQQGGSGSRSTAGSGSGRSGGRGRNNRRRG